MISLLCLGLVLARATSVVTSVCFLFDEILEFCRIKSQSRITNLTRSTNKNALFDAQSQLQGDASVRAQRCSLPLTAAMTLDRSRHEAPRWFSLLLDVTVVALTLLLDTRDLWFKLRWVGPHDTFAFSTVERRPLPTSDAAPLHLTMPFLYVDQKLQRDSGWGSLLQQCESLTALEEDDDTLGFRFALGKNCMVGPSSSAARVHELLLTSSARVDSVAWTACALLYQHRKPPICHSPIVTNFQERLNFQNELAYPASRTSTSGSTNALSGNDGERGSYAAEPGSEAETGLVELLEVISKSSPISAAVCVEGFILKGPGTYTSSIFGCGNPGFFRSALVGGDIPMFSQLQRDRAWLTSNSLRVMGMHFLIRENRRSAFNVIDSDTGAGRILEYTTRLNCSASGSLYTLMVLADLSLLILKVCSVAEIVRCMLWPLWKPLIVSEYQTSSARTTKMGFALQDYSRVLQVTLLRSPPITILTVISRLLTWQLVIPSAVVWSDGKETSQAIQAFLTVIRSCDLVIICVNAVWDTVVHFDEKRALKVARRTYVSPLEVFFISATVTCINLSALVPEISKTRHFQDRQRRVDHNSFVNASAMANSFPVHGDTAQNTPLSAITALYAPLLAAVSISMCIVTFYAISRFLVTRSVAPLSLVQSTSDPGATVHPSASGRPSARMKADLTSSTAGSLMRSTSPPPSPPQRGPSIPADPASAQRIALSDPVRGERLPIEEMLDLPIRAKSLVRASWALEKVVGGRLLLLPSSYLEHGIVFVGRSMKTRCGFMDVVQPLLLAQEPGDTDPAPEKHSRVGKRSLH
jgi:hypothetical protein